MAEPAPPAPACRWCGRPLEPAAGPVCDPCAAAFRAELVYAAAGRAEAEDLLPRRAVLSAALR